MFNDTNNSNDRAPAQDPSPFERRGLDPNIPFGVPARPYVPPEIYLLALRGDGPGSGKVKLKGLRDHFEDLTNEPFTDEEWDDFQRTHFESDSEDEEWTAKYGGEKYRKPFVTKYGYDPRFTSDEDLYQDELKSKIDFVEEYIGKHPEGEMFGIPGHVQKTILDLIDAERLPPWIFRCVREQASTGGEASEPQRTIQWIKPDGEDAKETRKQKQRRKKEQSSASGNGIPFLPGLTFDIAMRPKPGSGVRKPFRTTLATRKKPGA